MKKIKSAQEILKSKHLLIENDRTCECHTHLVVEAMEEYKDQFIKKTKKIIIH